MIFAAAMLIVLPLLPDQAMGPFSALNPHSIWIIVILVMAIGAFGHIAVRLLGAHFGLPVAELASGFISSTATIGVMGAKGDSRRRSIPTSPTEGVGRRQAAEILGMQLQRSALVWGSRSQGLFLAAAPFMLGVGRWSTSGFDRHRPDTVRLEVNRR